MPAILPLIMRWPQSMQFALLLHLQRPRRGLFMHALSLAVPQQAPLKTSRRQRRPWSGLGAMICQHHWILVNLSAPAHCLVALTRTRTPRAVMLTLTVRIRHRGRLSRLRLTHFKFRRHLLNAVHWQGPSAGVRMPVLSLRQHVTSLSLSVPVTRRTRTRTRRRSSSTSTASGSH